MALFLLAGLFYSPVLLGFGGAGIGAGTIAATIQSAIGPIAAQSAFATVQSLAASGELSTATGVTLGAAILTSGSGKSSTNREGDNTTKNNSCESRICPNEEQNYFNEEYTYFEFFDKCPIDKCEGRNISI